MYFLNTNNFRVQKIILQSKRRRNKCAGIANKVVIREAPTNYYKPKLRRNNFLSLPNSALFRVYTKNIQNNLIVDMWLNRY